MHLVNTTSEVVFDIFEYIFTSRRREYLLLEQELLMFIFPVQDIVELTVNDLSRMVMLTVQQKARESDCGGHHPLIQYVDRYGFSCNKAYKL